MGRREGGGGRGRRRRKEGDGGGGREEGEMGKKEGRGEGGRKRGISDGVSLPHTIMIGVACHEAFPVHREQSEVVVPMAASLVVG